VFIDEAKWQYLSVEQADSRYRRGRDEIGAADFSIYGWELANGAAHREVAAGEFVDRVSIDVVDPDGPVSARGHHHGQKAGPADGLTS
jgi:hypothetical protein